MENIRGRYDSKVSGSTDMATPRLPTGHLSQLSHRADDTLLQQLTRHAASTAHTCIRQESFWPYPVSGQIQVLYLGHTRQRTTRQTITARRWHCANRIDQWQKTALHYDITPTGLHRVKETCQIMLVVMRIARMQRVKLLESIDDRTAARGNTRVQ